MGIPLTQPFRNYQRSLQPEELEALAAAYESAWERLWLSGLALAGDELSVLKTNLAQTILSSACNRDLDAEQLAQLALHGLSGLSREQLLARPWGPGRGVGA
jgi:hypothetical protein